MRNSGTFLTPKKARMETSGECPSATIALTVCSANQDQIEKLQNSEIVFHLKLSNPINTRQSLIKSLSHRISLEVCSIQCHFKIKLRELSRWNSRRCTDVAENAAILMNWLSSNLNCRQSHASGIKKNN